MSNGIFDPAIFDPAIFDTEGVAFSGIPLIRMSAKRYATASVAAHDRIQTGQAAKRFATATAVAYDRMRTGQASRKYIITTISAEGGDE